MTNLTHPIHNTMSLTEGVVPSSGDLSLLDCRVHKGVPTTIGNVLVVFTNPTKAARYLETKFLGHDQFESTVLKTRAAVTRVLERENISRLTVDPCPSCDWSLVLEDREPSSLWSMAQSAVIESSGRVGFVKNCVEDLITKLDFEAAFEILKVTALHLDCSEPEIHYLIGVCAHQLKDEQNYELALRNLKTLNAKWWQKLRDAVGLIK